MIPAALLIVSTMCVAAYPGQVNHLVPVVALEDGSSRNNIGQSAAFLEDHGKSLSIVDVSSPDYRDRFVRSKDAVMNFGYSSSVYWIRFAVENRSLTRGQWFIECAYPLLDDIRFFIPANGGFVEKKSGRVYPYGSREARVRAFAVEISPPAGVVTEYFIRVESKNSLSVPISIKTKDELISRDRHERFVLGMYYGVILVMILYNLFIFFTVRDVNYLYYVCTLVFAHLLFHLGINGLFYDVTGSDALWLSRDSIALFFSLGMFFFMLFSKEFLRIKQYSRMFNMFFIALMCGAAIEAAISIFADYYYAIRSAVVMGQVSAFFTWFAGFYVLVKGNRTARFYILAWSAMIAGGLTFSLKVWGLLPSNSLTEYSWQAGSALQAVLLAIALGDNINILRRERFIAQSNALEKERLAREAQERFREDLEKVVEERTIALNSALNNLTQKDRIIQGELSLAADMQKGLMPRTPVRYNGVNIVAYYSAMEKIGGDFYEIFTMKGGYLCVLVGDVSGHGIPAAFITALSKITFTEATRNYLFPRDIFRYANEQLLRLVHTQDYLTVFMVVISPSYEVFYSNASHPKALVYRNRFDEFEEWDTNGLFIGAVNEANDLYEEKHDMLDFGDRMMLYTDGLIEARDGQGMEFGIENLKSAIRSTRDLPIEEARGEIVTSWYGHVESAPIRDDVTFLLLEVDRRYRELLEYKNRGLELLYKNRGKEAVDSLNKALEIDSENTDLHELLARTYYRQGEYRMAANHYAEVAKSNSGDPEILSLLADSQYRCRRYSDAIESAAKACQVKGSNESALFIWAMCLKEMKKKEEAVKKFKQVLRINAQNSDALRELQLLNVEFKE